MDEPPSATSADDFDPIPISAIQHAVYCLRQAALIHVERLWEENRLTAEGRVLHAAVDHKSQRYSRGVRRVAAMPLACRRLGIAGVADIVEFHKSGDAETPYPIEYKRGRPKLHRADEAQLCAQALCLEEMTGGAVPEGALFYGETKRRVVVIFDKELRRLTEDAAEAFRAIVERGATPKAEYDGRKCRACSLLDLCRPKLTGRSAKAWCHRQIDAIIHAPDS